MKKTNLFLIEKYSLYKNLIKNIDKKYYINYKLCSIILIFFININKN
jgi:hypothetical protein